MQITIPYGNSELTASVDWAHILATLSTADVPPLTELRATLIEGLENPDSGAPLADSLRSGGTVLIIVSDSFRRTGVHRFLPTLLSYLNEHGIPDPSISFLFATGTHRHPTPSERAEILGPDVYARFQDRAVAHDPHDPANLIYRGDTSRGTPVYVNRLACEADTVIATGTVVFHYFGGFGGGRKSIVPGIAGIKTIAANHALNLDPESDRLNPRVAIGRLDGNPVAEDMLEGAKRCPVGFLINTVLNREGEVVKLFCGDLEQAHREACRYAEHLYAVPVREKADFVVASAGSAKNFVQSHKSLYNAWQVINETGLVILATPASEGYGGDKFIDWLRLGNTDAIIAELRKNAEINGQTALSTLEKARRAVFITEMSPRETEALGGRWAATLEEALAHVRVVMTRQGIIRPTGYIMPEAYCSVPIFPTS